MTSRQRFTRAGLVIFLAAGFVLWHLPLLTPHGRIRGTHSDAAIIGLMGKKIFEGRGFDFFFWGQNYVGPLTSLLTAAWAFVTGAADMLALRLAAFTEMLAGSLLTWWAVDRIDRRAAIATLALLVLTPPVLLTMMIAPLGAEMGFLGSTLIIALAMRRLESDETTGRARSRRVDGEIDRAGSPTLFGVVAGLCWWMNQMVVFALAATAIVFALRTPSVRKVLLHIRPIDRWNLRADRLGWRPLPGVVAAFVWLATRLGALLLAAFIAVDLAGAPRLPFVIGPAADPLLLILVPHALLPIVLGEVRFRAFFRASRRELAALTRFASGFVIAYLPVILGRLFGWYETSYGVGFRLNYPSEVLPQARELFVQISHWIGMRGPAGVVFGIALFAFAILAAVRHRTRPGVQLLALVPLLNIGYFLAAHLATKPHYLIASVGALFGLAAIGAADLWDRHRTGARAALVAIGLAAIISVGGSAAAMHRDLTSEPDPMPLLERVRGEGCAVVYADFWLAYRYRFLDQEQRAWIPYRSQNRTRAESYAMQKRPGLRCLVGTDGSVKRLPGDLPIAFEPPRSRPSGRPQ